MHEMHAVKSMQPAVICKEMKDT